MMEHSVDAWDHNQFKEVVVKVANIEICYKVRKITLFLNLVLIMLPRLWISICENNPCYLQIF
jgi:clathrin heavy chain